MKILKVEKNLQTMGYCCFFEIPTHFDDGTFKDCKYYYASICCTFDHGNECMIFNCNTDKVTEWDIDFSDYVYRNNNVDITKNELMRCITDFEYMEREKNERN